MLDIEAQEEEGVADHGELLGQAIVGGTRSRTEALNHHGSLRRPVRLPERFPVLAVIRREERSAPYWTSSTAYPRPPHLPRQMSLRTLVPAAVPSLIQSLARDRGPQLRRTARLRRESVASRRKDSEHDRSRSCSVGSPEPACVLRREDHDVADLREPFRIKIHAAPA